MRAALVVVLLLATVAIAADTGADHGRHETAPAAPPTTVPHDPPPAAREVVDRFRAAVAAKDADAVAAISAFPVRANDLGGDIASAEALRHRFATVFTDEFRDCIAATALDAGATLREWVINCNGVMFGFREHKGSWRFAFVDNVNE